MKIKDLLWQIALGMLLIACSGCKNKVEVSASHENPPNVIFILADDMGYGDVLAYNKLKKTEGYLFRLYDTIKRLKSNFENTYKITIL